MFRLRIFANFDNPDVQNQFRIKNDWKWKVY